MTSDTSTARTHDGTPTRGFPRPLLWVLLVATLVVNGRASFLEWPLAVGIATGVLALATGGWLVRDHYRRRARS